MSKSNDSIPAQMGERLLNGIFKENPTFVLLLGMCPTLAVTTSAINGLGMGLTTMVVLAMSNLIISLLRKVIPDKIRIPAFIVIIASFVTIVELLLKAYIPTLYDALGIYIPLIVVNCIILGRAEAYAYSHKPIPSLFDGIGMGLGFSMALTIIGAFRELLGSGKVFDIRVMPDSFVPVSIFVMAPGAFFVLAMLTALQNWIKDIGTKRGRDMSKIQSGCGGNCMECDKDCKKPETVASHTVEPGEEIKAQEPVASEGIEEAKEENAEAVVEVDKAKAKAEREAEEEALRIAEEAEAKARALKEAEELISLVEHEEPKTTVTEEDSDFEILDLSDYKALVKPAAKKPVRKKGSIDRARMMLSKAEEQLKEDENND